MTKSKRLLRNLSFAFSFYQKGDLHMSWQSILAENLTTAEDLIKPLHLRAEEAAHMQKEIDRFPMSVTRYYLSLIDPDDPADPIRKMAVPSGNTIMQDGELDTSGEKSNTKLRGMQHKYAETVLILTTSACAMYCRHCFRKRLVGTETEEIAADIDSIIEYIRRHPAVNNVLLSGGDSFLMPDDRIRQWLGVLTGLDQLDLIRFGTRTPVTFPQRILEDKELLEILAEAGTKKQIYVITHFNHPKELTDASGKAIRALQRCGIVVKNQTVLLRGVNDDPLVLSSLLRKITSLGIIQHYIFQCRPVKGIKSDFQVPLLQGSRIINKALSLQNGPGKAADYTMSHITGKIRILGEIRQGELLMQYKQAKDPSLIGVPFTLSAADNLAWLPDNFKP